MIWHFRVISLCNFFGSIQLAVYFNKRYSSSLFALKLSKLGFASDMQIALRELVFPPFRCRRHENKMHGRSTSRCTLMLFAAG
jgi:hypothetical protein